MKDTITTSPFRANSFATSLTLRRFSSLSSSENPRSLFSVERRLSPSRTIEWIDSTASFLSSSTAIVLLPEPESPHIQKTAPLCPSRFSFSVRASSRLVTGWMFSEGMEESETSNYRQKGSKVKARTRHTCSRLWVEWIEGVIQSTRGYEIKVT